MNLDKTKIVVFRKEGMISKNMKSGYGNSDIYVTNKIVYLGIVRTYIWMLICRGPKYFS